MKLFSTTCIALAAAKKNGGRNFQGESDELLYSNDASFVTGDFMPDRFPITGQENYEEQLDSHNNFAERYYNSEFDGVKNQARYMSMFSKISTMVEKAVDKCVDWDTFVAPEVNEDGSAFDRDRRAPSGIGPLTGTITNLAHIVRQLVIPAVVESGDKQSKKCLKQGYKILRKMDRHRLYTLWGYCKDIDREAVPCTWAYEANDGKPWRNLEDGTNAQWDSFTASFHTSLRNDRVCDNGDSRFDDKISCEMGEINVVNAWYGRRSTKICKGDNSATDICTGFGSIVNLVSKVQADCNGQAECVLEATEEYAGRDPCPGSDKYIQVTYECVVPEGSAEGSGM
jgi:hypothetical protein